MAQDFRNVLVRTIGTSDTTLLAGGNYDAVIGIRCCNILTSTIAIDVKIAKIQTRENLENALKYNPMVTREREKFVIVKPSFTAKAEAPLHHTLQ